MRGEASVVSCVEAGVGADLQVKDGVCAGAAVD